MLQGIAVVLFLIGIEEIIIGIFSPREYRWPTIGLGILVLVFAAIAMSFPVAVALTIVVFLSIAFLVNGIARFFWQAFRYTKSISNWCWNSCCSYSATVLISPLFFGARLAGTIIGIGILITGIQMVFARIRGRYAETPSL